MSVYTEDRHKMLEELSAGLAASLGRSNGSEEGFPFQDVTYSFPPEEMSKCFLNVVMEPA